MKFIEVFLIEVKDVIFQRQKKEIYINAYVFHVVIDMSSLMHLYNYQPINNALRLRYFGLKSIDLSIIYKKKLSAG